MLSTALPNAVCLYSAFLGNYFCQIFLFSFFLFDYCHLDCLFEVWFCIMHNAFNQLVFRNSMFISVFNDRAMRSQEKYHLNITINFIITSVIY